jgi:hypothetical protein
MENEIHLYNLGFYNGRAFQILQRIQNILLDLDLNKEDFEEDHQTCKDLLDEALQYLDVE